MVCQARSCLEQEMARDFKFEISDLKLASGRRFSMKQSLSVFHRPTHAQCK